MVQRYTARQVIAALQRTKGLRYLAAKELGCTIRTLNNYLNRSAAIKEAAEAERGQLIDLAESRLFSAMMAGEAWAITFCLKTQGKERGYTERHEVREIKELSDNDLRNALAQRLGIDVGTAERSGAARDSNTETLH